MCVLFVFFIVIFKDVEYDCVVMCLYLCEMFEFSLMFCEVVE